MIYLIYQNGNFETEKNNYERTFGKSIEADRNVYTEDIFTDIAYVIKIYRCFDVCFHTNSPIVFRSGDFINTLQSL